MSQEPILIQLEVFMSSNDHMRRGAPKLPMLTCNDRRYFNYICVNAINIQSYIEDFCERFMVQDNERHLVKIVSADNDYLKTNKQIIIEITREFPNPNYEKELAEYNAWVAAEDARVVMENRSANKPAFRKENIKKKILKDLAIFTDEEKAELIEILSRKKV